MYAMMKGLRLHYPLAFVSRVLDVSAGGYYAWLGRPLSKWAREELRLEVEIIPVADNILGQQFKVSAPNKVWASDIAYVPTDEGWLYVAGHKGLFTGNIVGYAVEERLTRNLASQSLFQAVTAKRPGYDSLDEPQRELL